MQKKVANKSKSLKTIKTRIVKGKSESSRVVSTPAFGLNRSYSSLLYGILTVLVLFGIFFIGYKLINPRTMTGSITPEAAVTTNPETVVKDSSLYTVQEGDTLWSISEKMYKTGFKWTDIAQANKLANPAILEAGTKLSIPESKGEMLAQNTNLSPTTIVEPTKTMDNAQTQTGANTVSGTTYTVQTGDDLWDIAVRAYGNGYKWVEVARANQLANPDIIHSGNVLKLPR